MRSKTSRRLLNIVDSTAKNCKDQKKKKKKEKKESHMTMNRVFELNFDYNPLRRRK
jgi:hypothetical protein